MATIYTRASKGSALTWTEGDANITNLNNELIAKVASVSGGTGISIGGTSTAPSVALANTAVTAGSYTFTNITVDAQGRITAASNGTAFNGTVGATTPNSGAFTTLSASSTVSGTGFSTYLASPPAIGGTTAAAGRFTALTVTSGTNSIISESNGNIAIQPNGTGQTVIKNLEYNENIFSLGTTSGTITPDVANGNVQTITLNGNLTFSAFSNPVVGQSITLIINTNGTNRTLTSTMKFSGGSKTLSITNTTDIISVFYDGTTYWASLSTDFK